MPASPESTAAGSTVPVLLVEREGGVATVTLNRPEARNALSTAVLAAIAETMADLDHDETIGAVVLTGADPAFCAGLDLKEVSSGKLDVANASGPGGMPWAPVSKPVIGAVNGVAVTGGLELALNCDFLIASEKAMFADTHARIGIHPGWGLTYLLPERVGFAMARRMSFTGDYVDASRALEAGLVTEVVAHDQLLAAARALAATIAANNRPALLAIGHTYRLVEAEVLGGSARVERSQSKAWMAQGGTAGVAARVSGVVERGRQQISGS